MQCRYLIANTPQEYDKFHVMSYTNLLAKLCYVHAIDILNIAAIYGMS